MGIPTWPSTSKRSPPLRCFFKQQEVYPLSLLASHFNKKQVGQDDFSRDLVYMFSFMFRLSLQQRLSSPSPLFAAIESRSSGPIPGSLKLGESSEETIKMIKRLFCEVGMRMSLEEKGIGIN